MLNALTPHSEMDVSCHIACTHGQHTSGHDLDAHIAPIVLQADGTPALCLMLQAEEPRTARQEVARIVKGVEAYNTPAANMACILTVSQSKPQRNAHI
jgi:hypothetical protein